MGKFPVTYDEKLKQHRLMVDGELLVPGVVPVDATQGKGPNHLQVDADAGLAVRSETFVSTDDGNQLEVGQDGKLFVREVSPDSLLSQDKSNQLSVTDGIYYNVGDHLSEDENNLLVARDGKLFVGKVSAVSDDEGNILQQGTDSGALLKMDSLVSLDLGNRIVLGSDNKLSAPVQLSKEEGNFLRLGNDQMLYINGADIVSNEAKNMLEVSSRDGKLFVSRDNLVPPPIVAEDEGNIIVAGGDGGALLKMAMLVSHEEENYLIISEEDNRLVVRSPLSMQEGNYLRHGEDGGIYADGNDLLSNESDNILGISKVDGKIYLSHEDYVTTVSKENGNVLRPGADGGALLLI